MICWTSFPQGEGTMEDMDELDSLAQAVQDGSLCALGGWPPTRCSPPCAISGTNTRPTSWKKCPAGVCKDLITYTHRPGELHRLHRSAPGNAPQGSISGVKKKPHRIDASLCIRCGVCVEACKFGAIEVF